MADNGKPGDISGLSFLPHQERVNIEMFKAIETLGRKLEKSEGERDRLARRLALIESSASVDEKTGRLYLPAKIDSAGLPQGFAPQRPSKWPAAAAAANTVIALFTLGVVLFHEPVAPQTLTPQQLAALNSIVSQRFSMTEESAWKRVSDHPAVAAPAPELAKAEEPPPLPGSPEFIGPVKPPETVLAAAPDVQAVEPAAGETLVLKAEEVPAPAAEALKAEDQPVELAGADTEAKPEPKKIPQKAAPLADEYGVTHDPKLPAKLADLEKRAFQNVPEAQHDLATLYASGKIVGQDYKRAVYWFSRAADGGIANAYYNLGVMFQQGLGVHQDVRKSLGWYQKAAQMGHPEAMYNLGIAYIEGVGAGRDIEKGVAYFKQAANAGVAQAAYNLGVLYESNFVGAINNGKALEWYQVAANEGHGDAQAAVERLRVPDEAQGLAAADLVEPAAGEEQGEGDASPPEDNAALSAPPVFKSDLVLRIQELLVAQGFLPSTPPPGGSLDPRTEDAIRAWQGKAGLEPDGRPTKALLDRMTAGR